MTLKWINWLIWWINDSSSVQHALMNHAQKDQKCVINSNNKIEVYIYTHSRLTSASSPLTACQISITFTLFIICKCELVKGQFDFMLTLKTAFRSNRKKCRPERLNTSAWAMGGGREWIIVLHGCLGVLGDVLHQLCVGTQHNRGGLCIYHSPATQSQTITWPGPNWSEYQRLQPDRTQ